MKTTKKNEKYDTKYFFCDDLGTEIFFITFSIIGFLMFAAALVLPFLHYSTQAW